MRPLRAIARLCLYLDSDGNGLVELKDAVDGAFDAVRMDTDGDGFADLVGLALLLAKMLTFVLVAVALSFLRRCCRRRSRSGKARELLIFTCSPRVAVLPNALQEATEVSRAVEASIFAGGDVTAAVLQAQLLSTPTRRFLFIGHTDARMANQRTLGFTHSDGTLSTVAGDGVAQLLGRFSPANGGVLELVFLNGCRSDKLARAIHNAGIPFVVAWKTRCHDAAARVFSRCFFETLRKVEQEAGRGRVGKEGTYSRAYREAVAAITFETRMGTLANGIQARVPRFIIRDPDDKDAAGPESDQCTPAPSAAGIPMLLVQSREGTPGSWSFRIRRNGRLPLVDVTANSPEPRTSCFWKAKSR